MFAVLLSIRTDGLPRGARRGKSRFGKKAHGRYCVIGGHTTALCCRLEFPATGRESYPLPRRHCDLESRDCGADQRLHNIRSARLPPCLLTAKTGVERRPHCRNLFLEVHDTETAAWVKTSRTAASLVIRDSGLESRRHHDCVQRLAFQPRSVRCCVRRSRLAHLVKPCMPSASSDRSGSPTASA